MSDFLGSLVERSLPIVSDARLETRLSPRLPSRFEILNDDGTGPQIISRVPVEPGRVLADREQDSQQHNSLRTISLPNPSSLPAPVVKDITDDRAGRGSLLDGMTLAAKERPEETPVHRSLQPQIIAHEPVKVTSTSRETAPATTLVRQLIPTPPPRGPFDKRFGSVDKEKVEQDNDNSAPIVHINIGRIEVRAVHPSQPSTPPRKTLPQPKMSLENYLQRRNEGKR
jgi:hypothetical protein